MDRASAAAAGVGSAMAIKSTLESLSARSMWVLPIRPAPTTAIGSLVMVLGSGVISDPSLLQRKEREQIGKHSTHVLSLRASRCGVCPQCSSSARRLDCLEYAGTPGRQVRLVEPFFCEPCG